MRWRCEWCGKPHEENDPPCDNCGHGKFEEAVVQQAGAGDGQDSMLVWVCTACGREHAKNSPPCSRCNNATFERREKVVTDGNLTDGPNANEIGSVEQETMTGWVCQNCGKEHTKNTPPCDRCGTATFERETKTISDDELTIPGYLDLVTPRYAAVLGVVLLIAVVFGLGAAGVVDLPFFPDNGVPEVENVPGNATTTEGGVSLASVESAYVESLNDQRAAAGLDPVARSDRLGDIAAFYNQQRVKADFQESPVDYEKTRELILEECRFARPDRASIPIDSGATATGLGESVSTGFDALVEPPDNEYEYGSFDSIGVDVHAVEGTLYVYRVLCVQ
jgi:ribosomal protein L37E